MKKQQKNLGNMNLENLKVDEYTTPSPFFVKENDTVVKVLEQMEKREIRHLPVLNEKGEAVGLISDRDVAAVKAFAFKADIKARDIMSPDPVSVNIQASLLEAAYEMSSRKIGSLVVNDNSGNIYGIFTSTDALNALVEVLRGDIGSADNSPQENDY